MREKNWKLSAKAQNERRRERRAVRQFLLRWLVAAAVSWENAPDLPGRIKALQGAARAWNRFREENR